MECESDSSEDNNYEQEVTSDTDFSDISEDKIKAMCVNEWTYVTDPLSDKRKTPLTEFQRDVKMNLAVLLSNAKCPFDYFEKIIPCSCKWTNERAYVYFKGTEYKTIMVYAGMHNLFKIRGQKKRMMMSRAKTEREN